MFALSIRKILTLVIVTSVFVVLAPAVFAQEDPSPSPSGIYAPAGSIDPNIEATNLPQLVINLLFGAGIFFAVVYLMYGGVRWITSRGDKMGVADARKHIIAAIIGLVVVVGTFFIIQLVFTVVGSGGNNPLQKGFSLPTLSNPTGVSSPEPTPEE